MLCDKLKTRETSLASQPYWFHCSKYNKNSVPDSELNQPWQLMFMMYICMNLILREICFLLLILVCIFATLFLVSTPTPILFAEMSWVLLEPQYADGHTDMQYLSSCINYMYFLTIYLYDCVEFLAVTHIVVIVSLIIIECKFCQSSCEYSSHPYPLQLVVAVTNFIVSVVGLVRLLIAFKRV
jgi:hypothetical protein